jgi:hypothetical protein
MNAAEECYARLLAAQRAPRDAIQDADDSKERQRLALNAKIWRRLPKGA